MKINILYVHSGDDWIAGSEKVFLSLMERLPKSRYRPHLLCDQPAMAEAARKLGVTVRMEKSRTFWLDYHGGDRHPLPYLKSLGRVRRCLKEWEIGIVHVTNAIPVQYVLPAAKWFRIPLVAHIQTRFLKRVRYGSLVCFADRIVAVSEAVAFPYRAMRLCAKKVRVIYNAVDMGLFPKPAAAAVKREFGFSENDLVAGTVAYLIPRKGLDTFVAAAGLLRNEKNLGFVIAGEGPMAGEIEKMIREAGLQERVKMLGRRGDIPRVLGGLDLFCLLSRSDPLPYAAIEACAAGLPVVATDVDGVREIVENGTQGVLVPPDDAAAAADAILRLARDPNARRVMGAAGRLKAQARFSYEKHVGDMTALYEELLHEKRG